MRPATRPQPKAGSFGFARASASASVKSGSANLSGAIGWQNAAGIDSFGAPGGDLDGYHNLSGRVRGRVTIASSVKLGASAIWLTGRSQFDGYDPITFKHTDTLDNSRNQLRAGRLWADFGGDFSPWSGSLSGTLLGSSDRNFLADAPQNRTSGTRRTLEAQVVRTFSTGAVKHQLIVAADSERETFHARDTIYGGFTDQDRLRDHNAITGEWRASTPALTGDFAVRRDMFNGFKDATSLRASLITKLGGGFALAGSYAEGISEPTFFDLYGFFPANFVGNPLLRPESSSGFETSLRYRKGLLAARSRHSGSDFTTRSWTSPIPRPFSRPQSTSTPRATGPE